MAASEHVWSEYGNGAPDLSCISGTVTDSLRQAIAATLPLIEEGLQSFLYEVKSVGNDGHKDYCTSVDLLAQHTIIQILEQYDPDAGFLAEEKGVRRWIEGSGRRFTVDGMDGTLHFMKGWLHKVSAMASSVTADNEFEAGCIGAVTTKELCLCGPGLLGVVHIAGSTAHYLPDSPHDAATLNQARIVLRREVSMHSPVIQRLVAEAGDCKVYNDSLGIWAPRLWKREFHMGVLWQGSYVTPWDLTPIIGFSQGLGYKFLRTSDDGRHLELFTPKLPTSTQKRGKDVVIIHSNDLCLVRHLMRE
jgi:fructose-1,6-bisphosphatase/inositol monophosphatase family enzyme